MATEFKLEFKDPQVIAWANAQKAKDLSAIIEAKIKQSLPVLAEDVISNGSLNVGGMVKGIIRMDALIREYFPKDVLDNVEKDTYILRFKKGDIFIYLTSGKGSYRDIDKFMAQMNSHGIKYGLFISASSISRQTRFSWKPGNYGEFIVFLSECDNQFEIVQAITFIDIVMDYKMEIGTGDIGQKVWEAGFQDVYNKIGEIRTLRRQFAETKERVIRIIGNYAQGMITNVNEVLSVLYENIANLEIEIKSELKAIENKKKANDII